MSTPDYDEDADFALGFESTDPTEPAAATAAAASDTFDDPAPAPADQPAQPAQDAAAATAQPSDEPAADPFAALPTAVRDLLGQVPGLVAEVQTLRRTAGMVPVLQSKLDKLERERVAPPPTEATPPKRSERVDAVRAMGFEEVADALEELHDKTAQKNDEPAAAAPPAAAPAQPTQQDPVLAALDAVRPSWSADLFSTDCQLWLSQQPKEFQEQVKTTTDPGEILKALAKFDESKARSSTPPQSKPTSNARQQRMSAAITPRGDGRSTRAPSNANDEDADMEAGFYGR